MYKLIPLSQIFPNPDQPRKRFDPVKLQELAASIQSVGVLEPVIVESVAPKPYPGLGADNGAGDGVYLLHDGERRVRAARIAGLTETPAIVAPGTNGRASTLAGHTDRLVRALVANLQREDLTPIEEARAFQQLREYGLSAPQIAARLGTYPNQVYNRLALLELEPEIQAHIDAGEFPCAPNVAKALMAIPDREARLRLVQGAVERRSSNKAIVAAAEKVATKLNEAKPVSTQGQPPAISQALAKSHYADKPNRWDALAQVGQLPPWPGLVESARLTCQTCFWRSSASETICRDCPLPDAISHLLVAAGKKGSNGH